MSDVKMSFKSYSTRKLVDLLEDNARYDGTEHGKIFSIMPDRGDDWVVQFRTFEETP